jgi:hypothetical protein
VSSSKLSALQAIQALPPQPKSGPQVLSDGLTSHTSNPLGFDSATGLVALVILAIALVLFFQGGRRFSTMIFNRLYTHYQAHRVTIRLQRVETLERIFRNSSAKRKR